MSAEYLTWQGDPANNVTPHRPSADDMGGDALKDDDNDPPIANEMPTAGGWNQKVKQLEAIARTVASAFVEVDFSAGAPFVARVSSPNPDVIVESFTVTDNGTGDVTLEWSADLFPPEVCGPSGLTFYGNGTQPVTGHIEKISGGVRVRTFVNGAAADVSFSFHIN